MEAKVISHHSPHLLDRLRAEIRVRHYSIRTEQSYADWARRFILFCNKRHPGEMRAIDVRDFISHLAVDRNGAASTQNQAKSALLFLYREMLEIELSWLDEVVVAKTAKRLRQLDQRYSHFIPAKPIIPPALFSATRPPSHSNPSGAFAPGSESVAPVHC